MLNFQDLFAKASKSAGVKFIGLMRQVARIKNSQGKDASDVLGFDYVIKDDHGKCFEFYAAEPGLAGLTAPKSIPCPLGIIAFDGYEKNYEYAIDQFKKANCGDFFTDISLAWPLTHPETTEPFWHIRSNLGYDFIVGANSGKIGPEGGPIMKYFGPIVVKYMGPVVKYMGPQS
jgi:hypothetical protein